MRPERDPVPGGGERRRRGLRSPLLSVNAVVACVFLQGICAASGIDDTAFFPGPVLVDTACAPPLSGDMAPEGTGFSFHGQALLEVDANSRRNAIPILSKTPNQSRSSFFGDVEFPLSEIGRGVLVG